MEARALLKVDFHAKKAVKTRGAVATASLPRVAHGNPLTIAQLFRACAASNSRIKDMLRSNNGQRPRSQSVRYRIIIIIYTVVTF